MAAVLFRSNWPASRLIDDLQQVFKVYTRAFVVQGVGIVGLFWCLIDDHPGLALLLTALMLADQAVFLRGRFAPENRSFPWQTALNLWCLGVSLADVLILLAVAIRRAGLRLPDGSIAIDPFDALAFTLATFLRTATDLLPISAGGRLLAAAIAVLGTLVGLAVLIVTLRAAWFWTDARRHAEGPPRPDGP